jgi:hypothetical protein
LPAADHIVARPFPQLAKDAVMYRLNSWRSKSVLAQAAGAETTMRVATDRGKAQRPNCARLP